MFCYFKDVYTSATNLLQIAEWHKLPQKGIVALNRIDECRLVFEAAFIALLARRQDHGDFFTNTEEELLLEYPEFHGVEVVKKPDRVKVLKEFRNWMKVALILIPADGKKDHLLDLVTRLAEGRHKKYIAGV